jgi:hypothetical protein
VRLTFLHRPGQLPFVLQSRNAHVQVPWGGPWRKFHLEVAG